MPLRGSPPFRRGHVSRSLSVVGRESAHLSLLGLSVGDAFGEKFFAPPDVTSRVLAERIPAPGPWPVTDDTIMAISIVENLEQHGCIQQDDLAEAFVCRYELSPYAGYGSAAMVLLERCSRGGDWRELSRASFEGSGSMGNGGAMRAAPIGGWYSGEPKRAAEEARLSAEITHAHPDGQAGAAAVAAAAAWVAGGEVERGSGPGVLRAAFDHCEAGPTRAGIERAMALPFESEVAHAAMVLGSGWRVLSQDTVPFALWCAARHLDDYEEALWNTVAGLGDADTTCAIVGGIVVLASGAEGIPADWLKSREPLDLFSDSRLSE